MNPVELTLKMQSNTHEYGLQATQNAHEYRLHSEEQIGGGTKDYRRLINKPTINGTELYDNYDEIDPTVHPWAKSETKPNYTAEEVGAIDEDNEMHFTDVKAIWDSVFNRGGN